MLSSIDIHYLVGILCYVSNPDDVEVILGDMVYNEASETERDVDITVTYKDKDGSIKAFLGYEVKDHTKPLNSIHIEQLCAKLKTHSKISKGYIVSSSGYTAPAKKIAKHNNIELYHLKNWTDGWNEFAHIKLVPDLSVIEFLYEWIQEPEVTVFTASEIPESDERFITDDCLVYGKNNVIIPGIENIHQLKEFSKKDCLLRVNLQPQFEQMESNTYANVNIKFVVEHEMKILVNDNYYQISSTLISGPCAKKEVISTPEFKILADINDDKKRVGCIITESVKGHLAALVVTEHDRSIQLVGIPVSDRLKSKIFRHKISF